MGSVSAAIEKTAKMLGLGVEVVTVHKEFMPTYVYYADGLEEPVPIYCDKNEENSFQDICMTLRNMIFVLSFHPKYSALKQARKVIMQPS